MHNDEPTWIRQYNPWNSSGPLLSDFGGVVDGGCDGVFGDEGK